MNNVLVLTNMLQFSTFQHIQHINILKIYTRLFQYMVMKRSDMHDYHPRNGCNYNQTRNKKRFLLIKQSGLQGPSLLNSLNEEVKHFRKSYKSFSISTFNQNFIKSLSEIIHVILD